jgi:PAS domain S-box-containing protein
VITWGQDTLERRSRLSGESEMGHRSFSSAKSVYVKLILVYFLLAVCMGSVGYGYYRNLKKEILQGERDALSAIAGLKIEQLNAWRSERMSDANFIFTQTDIAEQVDQLKREPHSRASREKILKWMTSMYRNGHYAHMLVLTPDAKVLLSLPEGTATVGPTVAALADEAMKKKHIIFSDLYLGRKNELRLDLVVPLFLSGGGDVPRTGTVVLRIDPRRFLFPRIQSWPTPSQTGETLLVRREGNDVVFLNEPRHKKYAALALRLPVTRADLPVAMGARGETGMHEGIDYRGVPVLAEVRKIRDSSWILVAKVDRDEIFSDLYARLWLLGIIGVLLVAGAGLGTGYIWRKRSAEFYRGEYEAELQRLLLLERYEYLSRYANDIILSVNGRGDILDANERAFDAYGYSRADLLGMNIRQLRAPDSAPDFDREMEKVEAEGGLIFETLHRKEGGGIFPVEVSAKALRVRGERVTQFIIRDITERRQAEEELRRSEARYHSLFENMLEGFAYCKMLFEDDHPADFIYLEVNGAFGRLTGLNDIVGKRVSDVIPGIQKTNPELFEIYGRVSLTGNPERFETHVEPLGIWFSISVYSPRKEHFVAVFDNVTERKYAEADLLRLNEELEERVAERTSELAEKNAELERLNRLFVGRELRMIELKEKLEALEAKRAGRKKDVRVEPE